MYQRSAAGELEQLVLQHAPLVKRIAYHLLGRLPQHIPLEDLIQAGMLGLLDAVKRFDHSKGASFETYAGIRIRGAMFDEIRRGDWTPRSVHRETRRLADAIRSVEQSNGGEARDRDVAHHLGLTVTEYNRLLNDISGSRLLSLDELQSGTHQQNSPVVIAEDSEGLQQGLEKDSLQQKLSTIIGTLPEREQLVLSLYYP